MPWTETLFFRPGCSKPLQRGLVWVIIPWHDPGWVIHVGQGKYGRGLSVPRVPLDILLIKGANRTSGGSGWRSSAVLVETLQEQEPFPCTSSQPGSGVLWDDPGGEIPTGCWGSSPISHLAHGNGPTKPQTWRSRRVHSKQEQARGWQPECPEPPLQGSCVSSSLGWALAQAGACPASWDGLAGD